MQTQSLINKGTSVRSGAPDAVRERTYIISGAGRGGTTLVAQVLHTAGLFIGDRLGDTVYEDHDILDILVSSADRKPRLDALIEHRNARHAQWGFKLPNVHTLFHYRDLARFRNPHLIFIFRDPQAIAVRASLAEYFDPLVALHYAVSMSTALVDFARLTNCPLLLLSYEKALSFPDTFIDSLATFCALPIDAVIRQQLRDQMQPNAENYIQSARRRFIGAVDGVRNGMLFGWCAEVGSLEPVDLEILVNGSPAQAIRAEQFRQDLLDAGIGNGIHGFSWDLTGEDLADDAVLRVRVSGRIFEIDRSGLTLGQFRF
jgi:hypothetical protein